MTLRCDAWSPCDMLSRATFMPASASFQIISRVLLHPTDKNQAHPRRTTRRSTEPSDPQGSTEGQKEELGPATPREALRARRRNWACSRSMGARTGTGQGELLGRSPGAAALHSRGPLALLRCMLRACSERRLTWWAQWCTRSWSCAAARRGRPAPGS